MRILIDIQTLFTNEKNRGIGIYTYQWIKKIVTVNNKHRFYVMKREGGKWYFTFISQYVDIDSRLLESQCWFEQEFNSFLLEKEIDIVHLTSPFMFDIELPEVTTDLTKVSYLVYDLIPLVMEQEYYDKWPKSIQQNYNERADKIKKADLILTISEASKQDLIKFLGIESQKIKVIYASTNEDAENVKNVRDEEKALLNEIGIKKPYIYSLTGNDPRKNNKGLINAFSNIMNNFEELTLVIGGIRQQSEQEELLKYAISKGVNKERLLFPGYVAENTLRALYRHCEVFVFPSLYEGFGLPVLEAMRSEAPVITSKCSSLPEITGDSAILVDPLNDEEIESSVTKVLSDKDYRSELIRKGIEQAKIFSWERTVVESIKSFESLQSASHEMIMQEDLQKPRLAYFSPLNPQSSGISDYSEELLVHLEKIYEVIIFVNGYIPSNPMISNNFKVVDIKENKKILENIDLRLYHVGNNEYHEWIIDTLEKYPGYVVLHDLNLFGVFLYSTYLKGNTEKFVNELVYNNGNEGIEAGTLLANSKIIPDNQNFPLFNRVVDMSSGVLVHSKYAADKIRLNRNYKGPIISIPSGITIENQDVTREEIQAKLNFKSSEFSIGVFGNVIPNKRVDIIIKVISKLIETNPEVHLRIIGHPEPHYKKELTHLVSKLDMKKHVTFIDSPDIETFKQYIKASDLCINLRWPTMGETSATLIRALGYGVPCIVSNVGSYMEYPDDCVWKVDVDQFEEELLLSYLLELCNNKSLLKDMGDRAINYTESFCDFALVSREISDFLQEV